MAAPVRRPGSYEDILALPEHLVGELIDGELFVQSRPAGPHTEAASVLTMDLGSAFHRGRGGPGGWIFLDEPELHLRHDILVPDLAAWRRERLPEVPSTAFLTLAPDWVCEVLSPSTARKDRQRKIPIYAREQVRHVWLVDPVARFVEVLRLEGPSYLHVAVFGEEERARIEPFDAIELELGALWPNAKDDAG